MWEEMTRDIEAAKLQMLEKERCERQLRKCTNNWLEEKARHEQYTNELEDHEEELLGLRGLSLRHLFHALLRDAKEQEESLAKKVLETKLKRDASTSAMAHLKQEIKTMESRIAELGDIKARYDALIQVKSEQMAASQSQFAEQLEEFADHKAKALALKKELQEAIAAAQNAIGILQDCEACLDKAENWGTLDLLGGGLITTAIKRDHMDEANNAALDAQNAIYTLQRELHDVQMSLSTPLTPDGFSRFADYFFDGLFADWAVQKEIHHAQDAVVNQRTQVEDVLESLTNALLKAEEEVERNETNLIQFIETAKA